MEVLGRYVLQVRHDFRSEQQLVLCLRWHGMCGVRGLDSRERDTKVEGVHLDDGR